MLKINYPGTDNYSLFVYDGRGRNVSIQEYSGGALTSTAMFVWCADERCEQRDASGSLSNGRQFAGLGEVVYSSGNSVSNFYTLDRKGSVREMTNSAGLVQAAYQYDSYGRASQYANSGAAASFTYSGYYTHARTGLLLTWYRQYSTSFGRWLSRDPVGELDDVNLYTYVGNSPIRYIDPLGLLTCDQLARLLDGGCNYSDKTVNGLAGTPASTELILCIAFRESTKNGNDNFDPKAVNSDSGATGLMQLEPIGVKQVGGDWDGMTDPAKNLRAGTMLVGYYMSKYGIGGGLTKYGGGDGQYASNVLDCERCLKQKKTRCNQDCFKKAKGH